MNCKTCMHERVCGFKKDFEEVFLCINKRVSNNMFNLSCNEYEESEDFKEYLSNEEMRKTKEYEVSWGCTTRIFNNLREVIEYVSRLDKLSIKYEVYENSIKSNGHTFRKIMKNY